MSIDLEHQTRSCTGRFQRHGSHWRCDGCGAVHYHCPDVEEAVITESLIEALVRGMTKEGEPEDPGEE